MRTGGDVLKFHQERFRLAMRLREVVESPGLEVSKQGVEMALGEVV